MDYINQSRTYGRPMVTKEMISTVTWAFNKSKETGLWKKDLPKASFVHFDRTGDKFLSKYERWIVGKERRKKALEVNARRKKEKSKLKIETAVQELRLLGIKPTIVKVAEILDGSLSLQTIKNFWRLVVPKTPAPPAIIQEEQQNISELNQYALQAAENKSQEYSTETEPITFKKYCQSKRHLKISKIFLFDEWRKKRRDIYHAEREADKIGLNHA